MTRAADVGATVEAGSLVEIKLPRVRVVVEERQAGRLRDALNTVLPERIEDLIHDPRIADVDVLRAAQALLAERWQDTENLAAAIEDLERQPQHDRVRRQSTEKVARTLRLLHLWGDGDPEISGPYANETERIEAAQDYRRAHGDGNGVFRLDVTGEVEADVLVESFTDAELEMPTTPALPCPACEAWAAGGRILSNDEWHAAGDTICGRCRFGGRTAGMHS